jgi:hypothetical protein
MRPPPASTKENAMNTVIEGQHPVNAYKTLSLAAHFETRRLTVDFMTESDGHSIPEVHSARILTAAIEILTQGEDLLSALTVEQYTTRVPLAFNGSVGGHYRHCLDHFTSFLRSLDSDEVNYDRRERDPPIETDPIFARNLTRQMREGLQELTAGDLARIVKTRCEVSYVHGNSPLTISSYARELVYAIAHAIHHYALISVMARLLEVTLPPHFGVAPSTVAHQKAQNSR